MKGKRSKEEGTGGKGEGLKRKGGGHEKKGGKGGEITRESKRMVTEGKGKSRRKGREGR